eukprot:CAMPEP_0197438996 /NCGR_PEP_ID=MMETSP1175-20131217/5836_1 /TAXON_ID=1003142 /ORGANISM="Triceratium dubium, Strain CCMP147" /LENGTH=332 /DNA_ID=CAMNT_0042968817 /DNA_START=96 /DNA_END=1095 /DNA_ORIENTATION=+
MTDLSMASAAAGDSHIGSGHGRRQKVAPMDENALEPVGIPVKLCASPHKTVVPLGGSEPLESSTTDDESSDPEPETLGPSITSDNSERSDDVRAPAPVASPPQIKCCCCNSLPASSDAAPVNAKRFSTGMIDEKSARQKRVSFGQLSVRKYPIVLGDHPECSCGPPVTIGWMYREFNPVDVDEYEKRRSARKIGMEMILPYFRRREILTRVSGHTEVEISEATREVQRVKRQRKRTVQTLPLQRVEEAMQTTMKGLRKLRPGSANSRCSPSQPTFPGASGDVKTKDASFHRKSSKRSNNAMDRSGRGGTTVEGSCSLVRCHRDSLYDVRNHS